MITHATSPLPSEEEALSIPAYAVAASSPIMGSKGPFLRIVLCGNTDCHHRPARSLPGGWNPRVPPVDKHMDGELGPVASWHWILKGHDVLIPSFPVSSRSSVTGTYPAQTSAPPYLTQGEEF
ncbi:hypothetical protein GCG54_00014562 [Colletotrichum gloeosporioides]|uniref:Uncharacterized protein n=1 Tax=Colletotrichum gloeosporioides TaxID=474922 RepID=A0A8H4CXH8_COLGL|nr:uncharacterized protein GCG54_00014562 [Colletotrichum gloeosporioides]KAF3811807.1 hypothetical protein GCG54_00014562 [Colletotrichum gloeosporioides]